MEKNQIGKPLCSFSFKGVTTHNNLCKHIYTVLDNGVVNINQCILSEDEQIDGFKVITKRFGKSFHVCAIGLKFSTLNTIHKTVLKTLNNHNINPENVL